MDRRWWLALGFVTLTACKHDRPPSPPLPPRVVAPVRAAAGDEDLRVMLAELASSKACGFIRGGFQGLRALDDPHVVTGVLWIRECEITNVGAQLTFHVTGSGWQWVDQTKKKGGGTFVVRQYVRFGIDTTIQGALGIAYDPDAHVLSLWFTPSRAPDAAFTTIGDVEVDSQGIWSSVLGAIGTVFATSPEDSAEIQTKAQGTDALRSQLGQGLTVTLNLCTGLSRVHIGRLPKGELGAADVGETRRVPVEIQPGGLMIIGPQVASNGMTIQAAALEGAVRLSLVCAKDAETIAAGFVAGRIPSTLPLLGAIDVRTKARLRIKPARCPVFVVASSLDKAPARFNWQRPATEIAQSTGGPIIRCAARQKKEP